MTVEWWERSGYCTRYAPGPSSEEERKAFWRITHVTDRCGDGEEPKVDEDKGAVDQMTLLPTE
jgi:hypothetical protein